MRVLSLRCSISEIECPESGITRWVITTSGTDSPYRRVNFNDRNIHLTDIERLWLRAFNQIEHHRHLIATIKFVAIDAIHPGLARHGFVRDYTESQLGEEINNVG